MDFSPIQHYLIANHADKLHRQAAIADRDEKLANQLKYNPKEIAAPFQAEQDAKYAGPGGLLEQRAKILQNHIYDPAHPERQKYDAMVNELEQNSQRGKDAMAAYQNTSAAIQKDPYLKQEQAQSAANDILHDENGTSRLPINQVNPQEFSKVLNDPEHFNLQPYGQATAKEITPDVRTFLHEERSMGGKRIDENHVKTLFHEYDDNGNLKKDPEGNPIIAITPATKQVFYNKDPRAKAAVQYEMNKQNQEIAAWNQDPENRFNQKQPVTEDHIIKQVLAPYAYHQENKQIGSLQKPSAASGKGAKDIETALGRHESIYKILNGDKIEISNLSGAKYLGHRVEGIEVSKKPVEIQIHTKDSVNPETGKVKKGIDKKEFRHALTVTYEDSNHILRHKTLTYKDKGEMYYEINNIYNEAPGQRKVSKEILDLARGKRGLYAPEEEEQEDPLGMQEQEDDNDPLNMNK
jgi:hypothetical protein